MKRGILSLKSVHTSEWAYLEHDPLCYPWTVLTESVPASVVQMQALEVVCAASGFWARPHWKKHLVKQRKFLECCPDLANVSRGQ
jgi:hypothetical protein